MAARPACRLFVLPARERDVALILRRGPSAWYHLILWHTDRDTFDHGAWFRGRIYEDRCDLSPDGELFVYFALQGPRWGTSYAGSWTAVSRPPWLHALALWPQGDTWGGGGRFEDNRTLVLRSSSLLTHPDHPATGLELKTGWRPQGERAEVDRAGNRIYARGGTVFRRRGTKEIEVADFNALGRDPQPAPAWAAKPLPWRKPARSPRRPRP